MGSHVAPGTEASRRQVAAQQGATIDTKVNAAVTAVLDSTIQTKIDTKVATDLPTAAATAVGDYVSAHPLASVIQTADLATGADLTSVALYLGDYPSGEVAAVWPLTLQAKARINAASQLVALLYREAVADVPSTPTPVAPQEGAGLDTSFQALKAAYIGTYGGIVQSGNVTALSMARALQAAVVEVDQVTYDLLLGFLKANMRRTSRSSQNHNRWRGLVDGHAALAGPAASARNRLEEWTRQGGTPSQRPHHRGGARSVSGRRRMNARPHTDSLASACSAPPEPNPPEAQGNHDQRPRRRRDPLRCRVAHRNAAAGQRPPISGQRGGAR